MPQNGNISNIELTKEQATELLNRYYFAPIQSLKLNTIIGKDEKGINITVGDEIRRNNTLGVGDGLVLSNIKYGAVKIQGYLNNKIAEITDEGEDEKITAIELNKLVNETLEKINQPSEIGITGLSYTLTRQVYTDLPQKDVRNLFPANISQEMLASVGALKEAEEIQQEPEADEKLDEGQKQNTQPDNSQILKNKAEIEAKLIELGYLEEGETLSSIYDNPTIEEFQTAYNQASSSNNIAVDGNYGPNTNRALFSDNAPRKQTEQSQQQSQDAGETELESSRQNRNNPSDETSSEPSDQELTQDQKFYAARQAFFTSKSYKNLAHAGYSIIANIDALQNSLLGAFSSELGDFNSEYYYETLDKAFLSLGNSFASLTAEGDYESLNAFITEFKGKSEDEKFEFLGTLLQQQEGISEEEVSQTLDKLKRAKGVLGDKFNLFHAFENLDTSKMQGIYNTTITSTEIADIDEEDLEEQKQNIIAINNQQKTKAITSASANGTETIVNTLFSGVLKLFGLDPKEMNLDTLGDAFTNPQSTFMQMLTMIFKFVGEIFKFSNATKYAQKSEDAGFSVLDATLQASQTELKKILGDNYLLSKPGRDKIVDHAISISNKVWEELGENPTKEKAKELILEKILEDNSLILKEGKDYFLDNSPPQSAEKLYYVNSDQSYDKRLEVYKEFLNSEQDFLNTYDLEKVDDTEFANYYKNLSLAVSTGMNKQSQQR